MSFSPGQGQKCRYLAARPEPGIAESSKMEDPEGPTFVSFSPSDCPSAMWADPTSVSFGPGQAWKRVNSPRARV